MLGFKPIPADVVKAVDPQVISTPLKPLTRNTTDVTSYNE